MTAAGNRGVCRGKSSRVTAAGDPRTVSDSNSSGSLSELEPSCSAVLDSSMKTTFCMYLSMTGFDDQEDQHTDIVLAS